MHPLYMHLILFCWNRRAESFIVVLASLTESSGFTAHGQEKEAINPYRSITLDVNSCHNACVYDHNCNGYSVDFSKNGCFLSKCNMFHDVSCSSCSAASRTRPTAYLHCPTNAPGSTTTTTLETLLETTENSDDKGTLLADNKTEAMCPCMCKTDFISILKLMEKRRKELMVDKSKLSANVRKRTCSTDSRTSSTVIGLASVIILIACGSMLICSDVSSVLELSYRTCKKLF